MPTVNQEVPLRDGLKWMLAIVAGYYAAMQGHSDEAFASAEDQVVDSFIAGLRQNGYEILPMTDE